jgi:hypothetical protein
VKLARFYFKLVKTSQFLAENSQLNEKTSSILPKPKYVVWAKSGFHAMIKFHGLNIFAA